MDEARLLEGVLRGVLGGGRRKRGRRTLNYLTGSRSGSLLANPQVLMTAAGLAWGLIESLQAPGGPQAAPTSAPPLPLATSPGSAPPPAAHPATAGLGGDAFRLVRLAVSAAHADGTMSDSERAVLERAALESGAAGALAAELARPVPLADIVRGVEDAAQRATLYGLAFAVARADEQVGGAERIYLAQLAHLLRLDAAVVAGIEAAAARRIDSSTDGPA